MLVNIEREEERIKMIATFYKVIKAHSTDLVLLQVTPWVMPTFQQLPGIPKYCWNDSENW
jgi:hypothetical protein